MRLVWSALGLIVLLWLTPIIRYAICKATGHWWKHIAVYTVFPCEKWEEIAIERQCLVCGNIDGEENRFGRPTTKP